MNIKTLTLTLKTDHPVKESPEKLRGYIGNRFRDYPILHHHSKGNSYLYTYPNVQYKIFEGTPVIVGLEEGADVLKEISGEIDELVLGRSKYRVVERHIVEKEQEFGINTEGMSQYQFLTPWLALNEKNYERYGRLDGKGKVLLLHRILAGNLLSISKGLEYVVLDKICVKTKLNPTIVKSKGIPLTGFEGEFQANFLIPDYLGIGKSVSRGFGTVQRVEGRAAKKISRR